MDYQKMLFAFYVREEVRKRIDAEASAREMWADEKDRYEAEALLGTTIEVIEDIDDTARIIEQHAQRMLRRNVPPETAS